MKKDNMSGKRNSLFEIITINNNSCLAHSHGIQVFTIGTKTMLKEWSIIFY